MMEIGVFSRTYAYQDLDETFRRMTDHGIYHTQFNLSNAGVDTLPEHISERKLEEIKECCMKYQIKIPALSGTFNMIDPDRNAKERGIRQFRLQCEIARSLDIPVVTLCTGSKNPDSKWIWHEDNLREESWTELLHTTEEILRAAEDNGIVLGVETEASNIINTPARARKYLDTFQTEHLKIIMDGANLFRPEQVPYMRSVLEEAFELLGRDIVIAHAKDFTFDGNMDFVAAGQGILDFPYYICLLKKWGYEGALVMHGLSEDQVPESRRFLMGLL